MAAAAASDAYLVTGASGFIGRSVCVRLLEDGATVYGVSRGPAALEHPAYHHRTADLSDAGQTDRLFDAVRPRYVLHLASCVTGRRELEWVRETLDGNLVSTVNVLVAASRTGAAKCVLAGSLEEPAAGEADPVPASPYAASKWAASGYARMFHALYGLESAVARIFMVYGPGQLDVRKLVPYVCLAAAGEESPRLMSGTRPVDWVFVQDVVDGLLRMAHGGPVDGGYVDLGTGVLTTTGEVATRLCALAEASVAPELGAIADRKLEQVRVADVARTRAQLGWAPRVGLDEGLRLTFDWYREERRAGRLHPAPA